MPETTIVYFKDDDETAPVLAWHCSLPKKAREKGTTSVQRLHEEGHELRRPTQDTLRDGVHELRWKDGNVNYRILFTIEKRTIALLEVGLTKEARVPDREIDRAAARAAKWRANPTRYTYEEENK